MKDLDDFVKRLGRQPTLRELEIMYQGTCNLAHSRGREYPQYRKDKAELEALIRAKRSEEQSKMTGFYGIPGREPRRGSHSVHAVTVGKPICGTRIHPKAEFQWCSHGHEIGYVECRKCKTILHNLSRTGS